MMGSVMSAMTKCHENSRHRPKSKSRVMYSSAICCKQLITSLCPAFWKMGMGIDAEIGAGVNQEAYLCVLIHPKEAAS